MRDIILFLSVFFLALLLIEDYQARRDRKRLEHVVYVNGIRGKSTVTRLIDAGLRTGGYRVFCKTTGTEPMTIGIDNVQRPLTRRGRANIKEQLKILHWAARDGAQILVIECMAVDPALQKISQERMVRSDIGVITNIRLDHTAAMGETLAEICDVLSGTIPEAGILFTADAGFYRRLEQNGAQKACRTILAEPDDTLPTDEFPENLAVALAVCTYLGVPRETALKGMASYQPDPYALGRYILPGGGLFVNALSANDPQSTVMICRRISQREGAGRRLILLVNNRRDRGYRTEHMLMVARCLEPSEIWLLGASQNAVKHALHKALPETPVQTFSDAEALPLETCGNGDMILAAGNIAQDGKKLMARVREEGTLYVP